MYAVSRHRFGKGRVVGCECTTSFTCGPCLRAAAPWHFTPGEAAEAGKGSGVAAESLIGRKWGTLRRDERDALPLGTILYREGYAPRLVKGETGWRSVLNDGRSTWSEVQIHDERVVESTMRAP